MMKTPLIASLFAILLAGCATTPSPEKVTSLADEARKAAAGMGKALMVELMTAMAASGPEATIDVCKEKAVKIAADASRQTGMTIRRVSNRNRNPNAAPDAWESEALSNLKKRLAAGEKADTLETYAVVDTADGKVFRYAKALVTQPMCLVCHGGPSSVPDTVKARIANLYPNDKATDYEAGMLRGAISIQKPL